MLCTSNAILGLAALSMVVNPVALAQQHRMFADNNLSILSKSGDSLTERIIADLDKNQFCDETSIFSLYSRGRPVTFQDSFVMASNDNKTEPAEFTFTKTKDAEGFIIANTNGFGREIWWQDSSGRQYITGDYKYEFGVRISYNMKKPYMIIGRGDRCLWFNEEGSGFMTARTACEPLEFKQVPTWNDTWMDPLRWKNCVSDVLEGDKKDGTEALKQLRWQACRTTCAAHRYGTECRACNAQGLY